MGIIAPGSDMRGVGVIAPMPSGSNGRRVYAASVTLDPPPSQIFDRPEVLRWAVGSPAGPRSQTWSVVGHSSQGDVFVGVRDRMGEIKFSLHASKWRLAWTSEAAAERFAPGEDRVVMRWDKPDHFASGWRHALAITVADSMLGPSFDEKPVKGSRDIAWFPSPGAGRALRFDLLLGEAAAEPLTVNDAVGEVGRLTLADGTRVWVVASEFHVDESFAAGLEAVRERLRSLAADEGAARGWAWGELHADGAPSVIDVSNI